MSVVRESEYNGKPLFEIARDEKDNFGFKFGVKKARMILDHLNEIRTFVEKNDRAPVQVG